MAHRILLCLDGSTYAQSASSVALQLAGRAGETCELTALHVVNVVGSTGSLLEDIRGKIGFEPAVSSPEVARSHQEQGQLLLDAFRRDAEIAGVSAQTILEKGAVTQRILHHAKLADLVIMGVRGEAEDRHPGQGGGHIQSMLESIQAPALVVGAETRSIQGIVLGYDGSAAAARALKSASWLAEVLGLPIRVVYLTKDGSGQQHLDEAMTVLSSVSSTTHLIPMAGNTRSEAFASFAQEQGANLVSVGRIGASRLRHFLFGGVVDNVMLKGSLMVLIAR